MASKVTLTRRQRWEGGEFVSDISKVFYRLVHLKHMSCSVICGFANLCSAEQNTEGWCHAVSAFNICMPLTAMSLMTCSSWPCLGSLASTGGACGPWSWSTCLFWEVIWSRTLCLPNPASLLILLSTAFNREPLQFTRVTPSKAVIRTPTPD